MAKLLTGTVCTYPRLSFRHFSWLPALALPLLWRGGGWEQDGKLCWCELTLVLRVTASCPCSWETGLRSALVCASVYSNIWPYIEAAVQSTPRWNIRRQSSVVRMSHISGPGSGISLLAAGCLQPVTEVTSKRRLSGTQQRRIWPQSVCNWRTVPLFAWPPLSLSISPLSNSWRSWFDWKTDNFPAVSVILSYSMSATMDYVLAHTGNSATWLPLPWQQWQSRHGSKKKKKKIWVTAATADTVKLSVVKEVHANKPNGFVRCSVIRASARCAPPSRCSAALALKKNKKKKERNRKPHFPSFSQAEPRRLYLVLIRVQLVPQQIPQWNTDPKIPLETPGGWDSGGCQGWFYDFKGLFCVWLMDFNNKSVVDEELNRWN